MFKLLTSAGKLTGRNIMTTLHRNSSSCKKLCFQEFGDPLKVLKIVEEPLPPVQADEVLIFSSSLLVLHNLIMCMFTPFLGPD